MMRDMRMGWLTRIPDCSGTTRDDDIFAVLMDWPVGEQTVTVLASSGGDASLYTTSGFGIIGGIGHEKVRKAAAEFVGCAQHFLNITQRTTTFPYPDSKSLFFYMVTPTGAFTVSFPFSEIEQADSPAGVLFTYGQNVVTALRQTKADPR